MRMLLDSHILVWFILGNVRLEHETRDLIHRPDATIYVSAASAWELATKVRLGKWPDAAPIVRDFESIILNHDFTPLPISLQHAREAGLLESRHKDPFDRILVAQAQIEGMPLATADRKLKTFGIDVI